MSTVKSEPKTPKPEPRSDAQVRMSERAKNRSPQYEQLSGADQWAEDRELGILDWDGR